MQKMQECTASKDKSNNDIYIQDLPTKENFTKYKRHKLVMGYAIVFAQLTFRDT